MAHWKSQIEVHDLIKKYEDEEISVDDMGKEMHKRIKENMFYVGSDQLKEIAELFLDLDDDVDVFDLRLSRLYDFGDVNCRIFVNCFASLAEKKVEESNDG